MKPLLRVPILEKKSRGTIYYLHIHYNIIIIYHSSIRELYDLLKRTLETISLIHNLDTAEAMGIINDDWASNIINRKFCEWVTKATVKDETQKGIFAVIMQITNVRTLGQGKCEELKDALHALSPSYFTEGMCF